MGIDVGVYALTNFDMDKYYPIDKNKYVAWYTSYDAIFQYLLNHRPDICVLRKRDHAVAVVKTEQFPDFFVRFFYWLMRARLDTKLQSEIMYDLWVEYRTNPQGYVFDITY